MSKPSILTWIDENWESVECQFYGGVQAGALNAALGSAFTGKIPLALGLAGISYAAGKTAEMVGCNYIEPSPDNGVQVLAGCKKISGTGGTCNGALYANRLDFDPPGFKYNNEVKEITRIESSPSELGDGEVIYEVWGYDGNCEVTRGEKVLVTLGANSMREPYFTLVPRSGATCEEPAPEPEPPAHVPGDPIAEPINHVVGGCRWTIQATDAYVDDQGIWHTYYTITADNDACGGPFAYWSSGNGPEYVSPTPPSPDTPDVPEPPLPPRDYNPRFDDIEEQLEQLKECACPEKPVKEGDARTISFRSDETSPFGKSRLRKRFKYRSQSGLDLAGVVAHWRDFVWQAGPVAVGHSGSSLGSPQVWASTVDEGKRVIRHACGEAGIDPDQVGEWRVGSSDNARYGMPGQMKVDTTGGYYWITARDGANERPVVVRS